LIDESIFLSRDKTLTAWASKGENVQGSFSSS